MLIPTHNGEREVQEVATKIPGLVWHEAVTTKGFTLTHFASGQAVRSNLRTKRDLNSLIRDLKQLNLDWTISIDEIRKPEFLDRIIPILKKYRTW